MALGISRPIGGGLSEGIYRVMNRQLAKSLKIAGFPTGLIQPGHKFYPREDAAQWSEATRMHGVTITQFALENRLQDIKDGYYCPTLSELIGACRGRFARLFVMKAIWFAESDRPELVVMGDTPEEAVGKLWLALNTHQSLSIRSSAQAG